MLFRSTEEEMTIIREMIVTKEHEEKAEEEEFIKAHLPKEIICPKCDGVILLKITSVVSAIILLIKISIIIVIITPTPRKILPLTKKEKAIHIHFNM